MINIVKSVGKLVYALGFLLVLLSSKGHAASIILKLCDMQGNEIEEVTVGQPFIVKASFDGFKKTVSQPLIPNLLSIKGTLRSEGHINFSHSYFGYLCRIDTPGAYKIGPVSKDDNGVQIVSNELLINAGEQLAEIDDKKLKKKIKMPILIDFSVDKKRVFVGQALVCTVRFCYTAESGATGEAQLISPQLPGFVVGAVACNGEGVEKIQGLSYRFVEWQWTLYPQEPGVTMIPAYGVDFVVHMVSQRSLFRFAYQEIKRAYSNAVHLTVDPLPMNDEMATPTASVMPTLSTLSTMPIGQFKSLALTITPAIIKQGEAAVLTVELEGKNESKSIDSFMLKEMPDVIKWYESKKYSHLLSSHLSGSHLSDYKEVGSKHCFEFIVQGIQEGKGEIPEQEFMYFDPYEKVYKTVRSARVPFSIIPAATGVKASINKSDSEVSSSSLNKSDNDNLCKNQEDQENEEDGMALMDGPWYPVQEKAPLSAWLCIMVGLIPPCLCMGILGKRHIYDYYSTYTYYRASRRAFEQARAMVKVSKERNSPSDLYRIFMVLFAQRCKIPEITVSRYWIKEFLEKKHCSVQEREAWEGWLDKLSCYTFARVDGISGDNDIYALGEQWLTWLEKKI